MNSESKLPLIDPDKKPTDSLAQLLKKCIAIVKAQLSITLWLFFGLFAFILWAAFFELEQSVRVTGQVIPSAKTQIIQATDGGVLLEIPVHEGQFVKENQLLAVLEKQRADAAFHEVKAKMIGLQAALVRTQAEVNQTPLDFDEKFIPFPDILAHQRGLYQQRQTALAADLETLSNNIRIAKSELAMNEALFRTGDTSQIEVMKSKRLLNELEGKYQAREHRYLSEAREEASKLQGEIATTFFKLNERKDILKHTELRAPVSGFVKYVRFNTLGGVLKSGDELMQITPKEGKMIIEAKVNPIDIAQLAIGQPANVKLDTFDYTTYGGLDGSLSYLSSDTLTDSPSQAQTDLQTYYRAYVEVNNDQTNPKLTLNQLKPGMTASVDIRTNTRTVLAYIIKPITRAFDGALSQK